MDKIKVDLGDRSYDILIGAGILNSPENFFNQYVKGRKCFIISDDNVFPLYGKKLISALRNSECLSVASFTFKPGEPNKNIYTLNDIYNEMAVNEIDRKSIVIALGGGVPGDISGFAAATFMRGVDYIQIPTSLLSMVDSSVGGKTAIDLPHGKNLVGAFWQPKLVIIDPETLKTLPERELQSGLAEVIKYGIIQEYEFFVKISQNLDKVLNLNLDFYCQIIADCCRLKAEVVKLDEHENGLRAILNYGHTFGHAIEAETKYEKYTHGEAVAIGMNMAAKTAEVLGYIDTDTTSKITNIISKLGLPVKAENLNIDTVYSAMFKDKKANAGKIKYVLPTCIGKVKLVSGIEENIIRESIKEFINYTEND